MNRQNNSRPTFEALEARLMMAAHTPAPVALGLNTAAYLGGLELIINGTNGNDAITLKHTDAGLVIGNTNGWTHTETYNYNRVVINAGNGNDTVTVDASVATDTEIFGGAGNDTLVGGSGHNQMYGGAGNNVLKGGRNDDTFITVGGGRDTITGNGGNDTAWSDTTDVLTGVASGHKIAAFQSITTVKTVGKKTAKTVTAVSKDLLGQKIVDPTADAGLIYRNFSNDPLFAAAGPTENDIVQGYLGDCYFLATLSSVAKVDPTLIKQSVVDLGDGTYAVQFTQGSKQVFVRVDGDLPTWSNGQLAYANTGAQNDIWAAVMEKAFAVIRTNSNSYASIEGGWMSEVYADLGKASTSVFSVASPTNLMAIITTALTAGKSVTYAAYTPTDGTPLIGDHAYTVDHVNYDNTGVATTVTLRNPWGIDGIGNDGANDGYVTVTAQQLTNAFMGLMTATV